MDYDEYRKAYFADPKPKSKFKFVGFYGISLFFSNYAVVLDYYRSVLGPPAYIEGTETHGWHIGNAWLSLFPSECGDPVNVDVQFLMQSVKEAELLHTAFIEARRQGS